MTIFINYAELTWPEVAALPRDTKLLIPLGEGYFLDAVSYALGSPDRVGLLPAIPYGWKGSGLSAGEGVFERTLANLLDSLREDGFTRVAALTPMGIGSELGVAYLSSPVSKNQSGPSQSALVPEDARGKVLIIPIGHTEQHGHHLPMSTDSIIIEAIAQGIADVVPERAFALPVMPYGVSTHRSSFAGTLNVGGRAFEEFYSGIIDNLAARGFDRYYLLSGHGGNCSYLVNVVKSAGERHRRIFCATAWLYLSGPMGVAALEEYRRSPIGGMGHAGELETSLLLHLCPESVHMDRVVDETDFIATPSYFMDWVEGGALVVNPPWDDDTATGAYGAGSLATAENGAIWLKIAIEEKIAHIEEIHEQHGRREQRRESGFGLWGKGGKGSSLL